VYASFTVLVAVIHAMSISSLPALHIATVSATAVAVAVAVAAAVPTEQ
jgi:hypothetical protein